MALPLLDFLVALFFLLSLVVVARFRNEIRAHDRESYNYLSGGLAVLAIVALVRIYGGVGLFSTFPFLSDPLFFRVLGWIGIITGATFVVSGVSTWLPLARSHKQYGMERVQRLELIKKVEQLVMVDSRLSEILTTTLDYMVGLQGISWGAVYDCTAGDRGAQLVTTSGAAAATVELLQGVALRDVDFRSASGTLSAPNVASVLPERIAPPNLILPVVVNDRVYGAFLLWAAANRSSDDDELRVNLKIAVDIIARSIDRNQRRLAGALGAKRHQLRRNLADVVDNTKGIKENFATLARLIAGRLGAEFVSLAVVQDDGSVRRLSIGASRTLLDEVGLHLQNEDSHVHFVLSSGRPLIIGRDADQSNCPLADLSMAGRIGSLMALPINCRRQPRAVLTVVSPEPDAYEAADRLLLESARTVLSDLVLNEINCGVVQTSERRMSLLSDLMMRMGEAADLPSLFQRVADLCLSELGGTIVRVATYSHDEAFMRSRALSHDPDVKPATPENGHLVMALTPLHRRVRDKGQVVMVTPTESGPGLAPSEASQAFVAEVESALLVPVVLGRQVLAVIGVADARPQRRKYNRLEVQFVRSLAGMLALAIRTELGQKSPGKSGFADRPALLKEEPAQWRSRIKSSLGGIMGSLEMIKSRPGASEDPSLEKYLAIIDKSAQRINDCFVDQTPRG